MAMSALVGQNTGASMLLPILSSENRVTMGLPPVIEQSSRRLVNPCSGWRLLSAEWGVLYRRSWVPSRC